MRLAGLDVPDSRLWTLRSEIAPFDHNVSFRMTGEPFLPASKGYNRWDGPSLDGRIAELRELSKYVMRHRVRGGRVELLPDGGVLCERCLDVFATLRGGNPDPALVSKCQKEDEPRDSNQASRIRSHARAVDKLQAIQDFMKSAEC